MHRAGGAVSVSMSIVSIWMGWSNSRELWSWRLGSGLDIVCPAVHLGSCAHIVHGVLLVCDRWWWS